MTAEGRRAPDARPEAPRVSVVRAFADMKHVLALLAADRPVLVVVRADDDARRALDVLAGWAHGAGGELDRLGSSVVVARPAGTPPVLLGRTDIVRRVEDAFVAEAGTAWSREQERELLVLAAAGSADARRRLTDAFSEVANVLALALRPAHVPQTSSLRMAHDELERIVGWPRPEIPMLVALTNAINQRLYDYGR